MLKENKSKGLYLIWKFCEFSIITEIETSQLVEKSDFWRHISNMIFGEVQLLKQVPMGVVLHQK